MGFSDIFKGVAGGIGGAAKGYATAAPDVMAMQQRRKEQADLTGYRDATLAQDASQYAATLAETQTNNRWQRAFDRRAAHTARIRADAERIRGEADLVRAQQASRTAATSEEYGARMSRAERAAQRAGPQMSIDQLDRIARLEGFTDYGQVVGVLQTGGAAVPAPGTIENPGESGLETIGRLRGATGMGMQERYNAMLDDPTDEQMIRADVRAALGR